MTEDANCPVCGEGIGPSDSVARYPDGICHIRCFPRFAEHLEAETDTPAASSERVRKDQGPRSPEAP